MSLWVDHMNISFAIWGQFILFFILVSILLALTYDYNSKENESMISNVDLCIDDSDNEDEEEVSVVPECTAALDGLYDGDVIKKKGSLYKRGKQMKSWKMRLFIMKSNELCYYDSKNNWRGSVMLSHDSTIEILTPSQCNQKKHAFLLRASGRDLYLYALTQEDRDDWIKAIESVILKLPTANSSLFATPLPSPRQASRRVRRGSASLDEHNEHNNESKQSNEMKRESLVALSDDSTRPRKLSITARLGFGSADNDTVEPRKRQPSITTDNSQPDSELLTNQSPIKRRPSITNLLGLDNLLGRDNHKNNSNISSQPSTPPDENDFPLHASSDNSALDILNNNDEVCLSPDSHVSDINTPNIKRSDSLVSSSTDDHIKVNTNNSSTILLDTTNKSKDSESKSDKSKWNIFLKDNEAIIITSLIAKKTHLGVCNKRQLVLTNLPRLFYVNPDNMMLKGEVKLVPDVKNRLQFVNKTSFKIRLDNKAYHFIDKENGSQYWIDNITSAWTKQLDI